MTNTVREWSFIRQSDGVQSLELFEMGLACSLDSELRFSVFLCVPLSHFDVLEGCSPVFHFTT